MAYAVTSCIGALAVAVQLYGADGSRSRSLTADTFHLGVDLWLNAACCISLIRVGTTKQAGRGPARVLLVAGAISIALGIFGFANAHIEKPELMFLASGTGLLFNVLMTAILWRFVGHEHLHTHSHGHDYHEANLKHLLADTLCSVGVTVAAGLLFIFPKVGWLMLADPFLSLVIGIYLIHEGKKR